MDIFRDKNDSLNLNLTPVIDIVFLLIIFFLLVCNFISTDSAQVNVPENCQNARSYNRQTQLIDLAVSTSDDKVYYFVQSSPADVTTLPKVLNDHLQKFPEDKRIINLRIDRNISFDKAKHALAAIAQSNATDIRISSFKDDQP